MVSNSDLILVAGATGGVGQLVIGKLLEKNISVRALTRSKNKARQMRSDRVEMGTSQICKNIEGGNYSRV